MTKREVDTAQQSQVDKIKARWSWLTKDIDNDIERFNTAQMLENSYQEMVKKGPLFGDVADSFLKEEQQEQEVQEIIREYDGHYVEDFEEGYAEDFEEERNVEVFKQEKKEQEKSLKKYTIPIIKLPPLISEQPMAAPSDHIYYIKPVFGEAEHP